MSDTDFSARRRVGAVEREMSSVKSGIETNRKDLAALKGEFEKIRREQTLIIANQERMTKALERLANAVEAMHEEMFPKTNTTKPGLKHPAVKAG